MKRYLNITVLLFILSACGSARKSAGNTAEANAFIAAIKALDKNPKDTSAQNVLGNLYRQAARVHLDNIEVYETLTEPDKWDKIIREYKALQTLTDRVNSSAEVRKFINPPSYIAKTDVARQNAAADYYEAGLEYLNSGDKRQSRKSLSLFKKANSYVPNYKDVKRQMDVAFQQSVLNVVINPVTDNSYYYSSMGSNRFGNSFNNDYMQRSLVRDLGGDLDKNSLARFYTDRDADRARINVDWIVDLTWVDLDIPRPQTQRETRNLSKQIEIGKDTSGRPVYQTVKATIYMTRQYFTARGELECRITDAPTRNNVYLNRFESQMDWNQDYATYSGDSRALDNIHLAMIQNTNTRLPDKDEILNELYKKIYPQVKNSIYNEVR